MKTKSIGLICALLSACTQYPSVTKADMTVATSMCRDNGGVQSVLVAYEPISFSHEIHTRCKDGARLISYTQRKRVEAKS